MFLSDNKMMSLSSSDCIRLKVGTLVSDRTFIDSMRTYSTNIEMQTLRIYSANPDKAPATCSGEVIESHICWFHNDSQ